MPGRIREQKKIVVPVVKKGILPWYLSILKRTYMHVYIYIAFQTIFCRSSNNCMAIRNPKIQVFWDVMARRPRTIDFLGPEDGGSTLLWNSSNYIQILSPTTHQFHQHRFENLQSRNRFYVLYRTASNFFSSFLTPKCLSKFFFIFVTCD
jgi:hypothetical protein